MKAWAIDTCDPAGRLLGVGWFAWPPASMTHLEPYTTAVFRTRKNATAALRESGVRDSYRRARVVRVVVTVTLAKAKEPHA